MKAPLIRRVLLSLLVAGLIAGISFLEIDNRNLASAIAAKNQKPTEKPHTDPIVPDPDITPSQIQAIQDKLASDGCNFNADRRQLEKFSVTAKFF